MSNELHEACSKGDLTKVIDLIEKQGMEIDRACARSGKFPIHFAAKKGHIQIVDNLLSRSAKTHGGHHKESHLLFWACKCKDKKKRQELLEYIYNNFDQCHFDDGTTRFYVQAALGNIHECEKHINQLLIENQFNCSPLYYALLAGHENIFQLFITSEDSSIACKNSSDSKKRSMAQIYNIYTTALIMRKENSKAILNAKLIIEIIEAIIEKTDDDKRLLAKSYNILASSLCEDSDNQEEEIIALQNEIAAIHSINIKTDSDISKLVEAYISCAFSFVHMDDFDKAIFAEKQVIAVYNALNQKTDNDKSRLEEFYKCFASKVYIHACAQFDKQIYLVAADEFQKVIKLYDNVLNLKDNHLTEISGSHWKLAQIYRILPRHLERKHPEILYKQALTHVFNIKELSFDTCKYLIKLFQDWQTYYSPNTLDHRFIGLCCLAFSEYKPGNNFFVMFTQIYNEIIDARNYRDLLDWLPTLIYIMEMILKLSERKYPKYCNGGQHIASNMEHRNYFVESIEFCKNINLSLAKVTEHNSNFIIAHLQKMSAMEKTLHELQKSLQSLAQENALLKTELAEYKSQNNNNETVSSLVKESKLPEVSVEVSAMSAANSAPTNSGTGVTLLPATTAVTTTAPATISSTTVSPFWQQKKIPRRCSEEESETYKRLKKSHDEIEQDSRSSSTHQDQEYLTKSNKNRT